MKTKFLLKSFLTIIYIFGTACVFYYICVYLQHSAQIPYPESMLPMMKYELAAWRLVIGLPLMILSGLSVVWAYKVRTPRNRLLLFLPVFVSAAVILVYFISSII